MCCKHMAGSCVRSFSSRLLDFTDVDLRCFLCQIVVYLEHQCESQNDCLHVHRDLCGINPELRATAAMHALGDHGMVLTQDQSGNWLNSWNEASQVPACLVAPTLTLQKRSFCESWHQLPGSCSGGWNRNSSLNLFTRRMQTRDSKNLGNNLVNLRVAYLATIS